MKTSILPERTSSDCKPCKRRKNPKADCPVCFGLGKEVQATFVLFDEYEMINKKKAKTASTSGIQEITVHMKFMPCSDNPSQFIVRGIYGSWGDAKRALNKLLAAAKTKADAKARPKIIATM